MHMCKLRQSTDFDELNIHNSRAVKDVAGPRASDGPTSPCDQPSVACVLPESGLRRAGPVSATHRHNTPTIRTHQCDGTDSKESHEFHHP